MFYILLGHGQSGAATRGDRGEAQKKSLLYLQVLLTVGTGGQEKEDRSQRKTLDQSLHWGFQEKGKAEGVKQFQIG